VSAATHLPVIDVGALLDPEATPSAVAATAEAIDDACRDVGFFGVVGHGVDPALQDRMEALSHEFFGLPDPVKAEIAMARAGRAWRGWFPVGGELTSGRPDLKEGLYIGLEHPDDHPLVASRTALHGRNLFPEHPAELGPVVLAWLDEMRSVADAVMRGIALGLGLPGDWFARHLTSDPTVLFRIFHYPAPPDGSGGGPADETPDGHADGTHGEGWGVAEHTDYGLLTVLAQDHLGGLEVARRDGTWTAVEPQPGMFVCNLGDMLERLTAGRYRSTPHRVRNTSGHSRLSFPYFFDPSWNATVPRLPLDEATAPPGRDRWDGGDVLAWEGTYGDYLTAKVAKVFPDLFGAVSPQAE
jgi:isopenicillin N synthase-like dioxygenase